MQKRGVSAYLVLAMLAFRAVVAETVLFDFETEDERRAIPARSGEGVFVSATNGMVASGRYALRLAAEPWRKGNGGWPNVTLNLPVTDWRGYDRLVVEVVSRIGAPRGRVFGFIAGPDGDYRRGWDIRPMLSIPRCGYRQWVIPLPKKWPNGMSAENVGRLHFCTKASEFPEGMEICFDRIALLGKGEPLPVPQGPCWAREIVSLAAEEASRLGAANVAVSKELSHFRDYVRFCQLANRSAFASPDIAVGMATSMEKVLPRGRISARDVPDAGFRVRLARDEYESVQIVTAAQGCDLSNVCVSVEGELHGDGCVFSATNIVCAAVGYVETKRLPPYPVGFNDPTDDAPGYVRKVRDPEIGWWPDPILGFLGKVSVEGTDVQSFWVRVHCPAGQKAGEYKGVLRVSADGVKPVRIPLSVRVNGFSVGRQSALPLAVAFAPAVSDRSVYTKRRKDPLAPVNMWKRHRDEWTDFLADYFIVPDNLYHAGGLDFDALERLGKGNRLALFNLGFWNPPDSTNATDMAKWRDKTLPNLRKTYAEAKRRGLLDRAYIYGSDEISKDKFAAVALALGELKSEFPGVPFLTTAKDKALGVGSPLKDFDWFCPETRFCDFDKIKASREAGHKVWWYICCFPHAPYANMFVECPAIEGRVLMGAQAVKYRPDGFLYYQISVWNAPRCIDKGPFTAFEPNSYRGNHGDGSWTYVGPDGIPLSSIRLENFRDGLEDYAYAKLLEQKLGEVENGKLTMKNVDGAVWRGRAHKLLDVPRKVVDTMTNYTDDPAVLYRWRDAMADLIEEAR